MALKRPEGLSPCWYSLSSPDIPESHIFRWTFRGEDDNDYQTKYTIQIMDHGVLLHTFTQEGSETELPMDAVGFDFQFGVRYGWTVVSYGRNGEASPPSVRASFQYESCPAAPSIVWEHAPKAGEVIVRDTYFEEIKNNVMVLLGDYDNVSASLYENTERLFTGEMVPARSDFKTLEAVIDFISHNLEDTASVDIDGPVTDSLGVSDLENIRQHIQKLMTVPPKPVEELSFDVDLPPMYNVYNVQSTNDGEQDQTMDISWQVEGLPSYSGRFYLDALSPSKDIHYYRVAYSYGPLSAPFTSEVYFSADFVKDGSYRRFDTDWEGLFTQSTLGSAHHQLQVVAVDMRGNMSVPKTVTKTYGSNFVAPLGVRHYEVEVQRQSFGATSASPEGSWYRNYTGPNQKTTYKAYGIEGRLFYRVRALDWSGVRTDWVYDSGTIFDPLTKPETPRDLRYSSTTSSIKVTWDASARAESYEVRMTSGTPNFYEGPNRTATRSGLSSSKNYTFYVRAKNRVGYSGWASIVGRTKTARRTTDQAITYGKSWNTKLGWNTTNGKKYVMQGEWCEIEGSPNQIKSVPAGHCWGKNKGIWIFDSGYWRSLLKGKRIVKVQIWVRRQGGQHGYYNDQIPTFWLHNYSSIPTGQPSLFGKFHPGKEFDLGESGWVTLPNWYGEYLRDGKAKGIGTYRDSWGKLPYVKFYQNAKLRITYE